MNVGVLTLGLAGLMGVFPIAASAASFTDIYAFGDSLLDTGNLFAATSGPLPPGTPPPTAVPFPGPPYPGAPYFNGRFSNGPIWIESVAPGLGLAPNPTTNFAFGGATSGFTQVQFPGIPGLRGQVGAFASAVPVADADALYVISSGGNDYSPFELDLSTATPDIIANQIANTVNHISTSIVELASTGAVSFVVLTVPDLGVIPSSVAAPVEVSATLSAISQQHNASLQTSVNALNANLGLDIMMLNVNVPFGQAIANPAAFGFTNVTDACFDLATLTTCANPDEYLFWDFTHPTAVAHQALAAYALAELEAAHVPEPTTALGLVALGALGARRWQRRRDRSNNSAS
ncbi:MAG: SGNH/GDSL hydrolase family protein [Cyanobacteria bacterium J06639_1]